MIDITGTTEEIKSMRHWLMIAHPSLSNWYSHIYDYEVIREINWGYTGGVEKYKKDKGFRTEP